MSTQGVHRALQQSTRGAQNSPLGAQEENVLGFLLIKYRLLKVFILSLSHPLIFILYQRQY